MDQISTSDALKNGKDFFKLDLNIIDLDLSNYNYKRSKKDRKIKKGQKNFFEGQNKGRVWKISKYHTFFSILWLFEGKNAYVTIFFYFRGHKGQKGHTKATTWKVCTDAVQFMKIWSFNTETVIYNCLEQKLWTGLKN